MERVLDFGCGTGQLTVELSIKCGQVTGVDLSPANIRIAQRNCARATNVSLVKADILELPLQPATPPFTTVVANMTLMTCSQLESCIEVLSKLVARNGHFIFTITHPWVWPSYWGYVDEAWFRYEQELNIEAPFQISNEMTSFVTTHIHRPLSAYTEALAKSGFLVERMLEPYPDEETHALYPERWKGPRFLAVRAFYPGVVERRPA